MSNVIQNYNSEARLRAIAMNAVREAMLVYQRWDRPFTDDDAARMNDIFLLLHLQEALEFNEHAPLVEPKQQPVSEEVIKVANLLGDEFVRRNTQSAHNFNEANEAPVAISLPKSNRAKDSV